MTKQQKTASEDSTSISGMLSTVSHNDFIGGFGKLDTTRIEFMQPPFNIRNNKQVGMWALDEETMVAKEINISIISCLPYYGKLGKGQPCKWLQVWFVASPWEANLPQNLVCVTYTNKQSVSELAQKMAIVRSEHNALEGTWRCGFKRHAGEKGDYYSVSWDWEKMNPELEQTKEFAGKLVQLFADLAIKHSLVDTGLPSTMVPVTGTDEEALQAYEAVIASQQ